MAAVYSRCGRASRVRRRGRSTALRYFEQAMRQWGFPVPADELMAVKQATVAFRDLWASIRPPWTHAFDGTVNDVRARRRLNTRKRS